MAPPKKSALPKPLPESFILTDSEKKRWRLGKIIGHGGFGLIYLASQDTGRPVAEDTNFVIKVEHQQNGPLFSELKFYQRAAKAESMRQWKRSRRLDFLGIPTYWGSGLAEHNGLRYRFMAMDRLGCDLQRVLEQNGGRLKKTTVLQLGQRLLTVLEYIHQNEYVHADIKAANLLLGYTDPEQVYLADYGLAYRFCPGGVHKEFKENPKKGHNGTVEFTSLDAHRGAAPSRRGDLQILGFCLLQWMCGSLPWDGVLRRPDQVQEAKARLMDNLPDSVQQLSGGGVSTGEVASFLLSIRSLRYEEEPDYQHLRDLLSCSAPGGLDLRPPMPAREGPREAPPRRPAGEGPREAPPRRPAGEGPSRHRERPPRAQRARGARHEEEEEEEEQEQQGKKRPEAAAARYRRGHASSDQQEEEALPVSGRNLRPRPDRGRRYKEESEEESEEEEEEEEEEQAGARSRPVPACYIWGPPIGPRPPSRQV